MDERARFFALLPFHVNGSLGAADAAFVRDMIARHPELQSQLQFHEALREQLRAQVDGAIEGVPADVGYARLVALRQADARAAAPLARPHPAPPAAPAPATRPTPWERLTAWLGARGAPQGLRLAQGLAFGLALGTGAMVALQLPVAEAPAMRGVAAAGVALLRVSFLPDARESELRLLLIEARATIVAGPTRLGDYYLRVPAGQLDAARTRLQRSALVAGVDAVADVPEELR